MDGYARRTARVVVGAIFVLLVGVFVRQGVSSFTGVAASGLASDPARAHATEFFGNGRLYTFELTIAASDFAKMPPPSGRGGRGLGGGFLAAALDDSGYPKVPATLRFEGQDWGRIAVRYKGNSSYRGAPSVLKRSLKLEFDDPAHRFFGLSRLNLNNNAFDSSQLRETLAYDEFRRTGVPAPRTAFARVYLTVPGQHDHEYAGLFTVVEQIDQPFFVERWGHKVGVLVKPEGLRGLPDLGTTWSDYAKRYSSKVTAKPADAARLIAFVHFVNTASDEAFAAQIGNFLDVDEFLRFLATEVVIVNTDSPLAMNHNYWITIHPTSGKVVWVPWDMNMAFGGFRSGDADLSLHQPSAPGMFPFADRILAVPDFRRRYDQIIRAMIAADHADSGLDATIDHLAVGIRDAVGMDQTTTSASFERNVVVDPSTVKDPDAGNSGAFFGGRAGPPLRRFVADRLTSIAEQLAGTRPGSPARGGRFGFAPPPRGN